jgi:hypothetical protein
VERIRLRRRAAVCGSKTQPSDAIYAGSGKQQNRRARHLRVKDDNQKDDHEADGLMLAPGSEEFRATAD